MTELLDIALAFVYGTVLILLVILLGLLYKGIDRKLAARFQSRVGPPIRQPFRDVAKLFMKETITPDNAVPWIFHAMPLIAFAASLTLILYIPIGPFAPVLGNYGDLILVVYLLAIPSLAMAVGGFSSGSPIATIGAQREMVLMMSYEFPLAIVVLSLAWLSSTNGIGEAFLLSTYTANPVWNMAGLIGGIGLIFLLASIFVILPSELSKLPFDIPEAETELAGGVLAEYSGRDMAMFYLTDAVKCFVLSSLVVALFFPYNLSPWLASLGIQMPAIMGVPVVAYTVDFLFFLFKVFLVMFFAITFVRVSLARLKIDKASYIYLVPTTIIAIIGMIFIYLEGIV